ncbi:MAG: T9SS type A sorting domain-containing protein, partial [Bacteroidales bacterium]|nr:T9SS type A sorting domain-containing protein [Bacteroidales bacterium]
MKKRPLPLGYFILTIALASIFISATLTGDDKSVTKKEQSTTYISKVRNNQVTGKIDPADYLKAVRQVEQQASSRSGQEFDFDWNLLGPNNLGGRTRALLFDNRDTSGQTLFAGSVTGGLFRSDNGGGKWYRIADNVGNLNVTSITQAGNGDIFVGTGEGFQVQDYTVLDNWGYATGFMGQGVFKSTDGLNFSLLASTKPALNGNDELEWGYVNEISAHPANGDLYAATNTGLKFSGDGGNSWQVAKTSDGAELSLESKDVKMAANGMVVAEVNNLCYVSESGNPDNFILRSGDSTYNIPATGVGRIEFAIPELNNDIIYALVVTPGGALFNIYRSDDKGINWVIVGPGGSANFNIFNTGNAITLGMGMFAATIEVFPDDPYHILVGGQDMWEGKKIVDDGYYQWVLRSTSVAYWLSVAFLWQGHHTYKFVPGSSGSLFVGTNGGISMGVIDPLLYQFQFMNRDYIASQFYTVAWTLEKKVLIGGAQDIGTIFIDGISNPSDSKRGNDIWTTANYIPDGKNGGYCAMSTIYPTASIYSRYPHPAKNDVLETFVRRNEFIGGPDYAATMFSADYASTTTAFLTPFLLYENFEDYQTRDSVGFIITKHQAANSVVWVESNNGNRPFKYITPYELFPGDSITVPDILTARFFIGGDDQVLMTKHIIQFDRQPEWYIISDKDHGGVEDLPQCMAHSSDANHLFVGTDKGKLYRISNIKYAYNTETADVTSAYCVISTQRIPVYIPGSTTEVSQVITSVSVDPNDDNKVIITLGNYGNDHYVYYSDNALDENPVFRSVQGDPGNGGLPQVPAYSSLIEMDKDNNLVMVGTEYGIYATNNIAATNPVWTAENDNIGSVPVFMLKQQTIKKTNDTIFFVNIDTTFVVYYGTNNYGVIYGATYGRGLISLDEFQKPVGISDHSNTSNDNGFMVYPNPANDRVTVSFDVMSYGKVGISIYNLSGNEVKQVDLGMRP